jgi:hypothetical protein
LSLPGIDGRGWGFGRHDVAAKTEQALEK